MRIHLVSDVHHRLDGLAEAGKDCDLFICLGDLILFLDYDDPRHGIFPDLFGPDHAERYIALRTARRFDDARALSAELWQAIGGEPWRVITDRVAAQYAELFREMPAGLLTYGNVDVPTLWADHARPDHRIVDGGTVEIGGVRIGLVGGGLRTPMRTPFEISDSDYAAKVAQLGEVDILCTHIPPAVPETTYDVVAGRLERGSHALAEYVRDVQPRYHLHGHVHQPLVRRVSLGRTQVVNVGHFRATGRPFALTID